mgnify:CR=1 FL=1
MLKFDQRSAAVHRSARRERTPEAANGTTLAILFGAAQNLLRKRTLRNAVFCTSLARESEKPVSLTCSIPRFLKGPQGLSIRNCENTTRLLPRYRPEYPAETAQNSKLNG